MTADSGETTDAKQRDPDAYGSASIDPDDDVVAGTYRSWTITYTVGSLGMDDGSTLKVAYSQTSDWTTPQFDDPDAEGYATVTTDGDGVVRGRYDSKAHTRPMKTCVVVDVVDGSLDPGDEITVTLGADGGTSPGHRVQSFVEEPFTLEVWVDPVRTGEFVKVRDDLTFDVVPGRARSVAAVAPSTVTPGEDATVSVRVADFWGNTATDYAGTPVVETVDDQNGPADDRDGEPDQVATVDVEGGTGQASVTVESTGVHRFRVTDEQGELVATTNPVVCRETWDRRTFWGDIHGQSGETVGTGTIQSYFEHACDSAFVDFASHAGNDFQITEDFWDEIRETIRRFHDPGSFVTFPCYEWSANSPLGGDHNVYFRDDEAAEIRRSSHWLIDEGTDRLQGTYPVEQLYEAYEGRDDVLVIPHQGGRPSTLRHVDPELTPFVEIVSVWGVFEWFGEAALEKGYPVGFVGGSDDHTGRPGVAPPDNLSKHNVKGGLMGAHAVDLTRDALWDTFNERRCYATTGARIHLEVTADGTPMGGEATAEADPTVEATIHGTAPLRRVDLFRGGERVGTERFDRGDDRVEIAWSGARSCARDKVLDWSGVAALDRGVVGDAEAFGFDHPVQGIVDRTATELRWDATTSGNHQGVRLDADAPGDATLSVDTPPVSTAVRLDDLSDPVEVTDDGVDAGLRIERVGSPTVRDATVSITDRAPDDGTHPYYVRVQQFDGEMAWSSPVFVTVE